MSACGNCPDAVTYSLRTIVEAELDKVRAIKELSDVFSRALQDIAALADGVVSAALSEVPTLPAFDFTDILGYLTCPLTPLVLLVDFEEFQSLDPTVQLQRLKSLAKAEIDVARQRYEDVLAASDYRQVINLARKYANEFLRVRLDPESFAKAVVISATVLAVCGEEEYRAGPYLDFANEIQDFSFVGGLPANLDNNVAALMQKLVEAETRFKTASLALV